MTKFSVDYSGLTDYGKDIDDCILEIITNLTNLKTSFQKIGVNDFWLGPKSNNFKTAILDYWEKSNIAPQGILKYIEDYKILIAGFIEDAVNDYKTSDKTIENSLTGAESDNGQKNNVEGEA